MLRMPSRPMRDRRLRGSHIRRTQGSPHWFDADSTRECGHDRDKYPGEEVRSYVGYSDFAYYKYRCSHPECDETYCGWIEG